MAEERLHKVMAAAGIGSRRACEQMILDGLVQVDGRTISEVGVKVDPAKAKVLVNGRPLTMPTQHLYIKLNKPRGVISDLGGDAGAHKSVADLLPEDMRRVFPVGRLDLNSEGLVLLTDDGELAHRLTHPSFEHPKTYYVLVADQPSTEALLNVRSGIDLPDGRTAPARARIAEGLPEDLILTKGPDKGVWLEIILREGKKRQIRHMLAAVNHPVLRLVRWAIGPLTMGRVRPGQWSVLRLREVNALRTYVGLDPLEGVEEDRREQRPEGRDRGRTSGRTSQGRGRPAPRAAVAAGAVAGATRTSRAGDRSRPSRSTLRSAAGRTSSGESRGSRSTRSGQSAGGGSERGQSTGSGGRSSAGRTESSRRPAGERTEGRGPSSRSSAPGGDRKPGRSAPRRSGEGGSSASGRPKGRPSGSSSGKGRSSGSSPSSRSAQGGQRTSSGKGKGQQSSRGSTSNRRGQGGDK